MSHGETTIPPPGESFERYPQPASWQRTVDSFFNRFPLNGCDFFAKVIKKIHLGFGKVACSLVMQHHHAITVSQLTCHPRGIRRHCAFIRRNSRTVPGAGEEVAPEYEFVLRLDERIDRDIANQRIRGTNFVLGHAPPIGFERQAVSVECQVVGRAVLCHPGTNPRPALCNQLLTELKLDNFISYALGVFGARH